MSDFERKRAEQIVIGDWIPFKYQRKDWFLEVVKVERKRKYIWVWVEEPTTDEQLLFQFVPDASIVFKEGATVAEEAMAPAEGEEGDRG